MISVCQSGPLRVQFVLPGHYPGGILGALRAPTLGMVSGPFRAPGHYSGRISGSRALFREHFEFPGITLGAFRAPGHGSWAISCPPGIILDAFRAPGHYSGRISGSRALLWEHFVLPGIVFYDRYSAYTVPGAISRPRALCWCHSNPTTFQIL